jgi:predicted Zn-dependent peptidase
MSSICCYDWSKDSSHDLDADVLRSRLQIRNTARTAAYNLRLTWLDDYPKAIQALTVDQVNTMIKKHLDPQRMVLVKAGTVAAAGSQPAQAGMP